MDKQTGDLSVCLAFDYEIEISLDLIVSYMCSHNSVSNREENLCERTYGNTLQLGNIN